MYTSRSFTVFFQVFQVEVNWLWTESQDVVAVKSYVVSRESTTVHFLLQARESKNLTLFLEVDICLFSALPVSSTATAQRAKLPLTSASRALTSEAMPTSLACFNSTPSWKSEPSFGMLLKNVAETRSYASRVIGLKWLRFHLVKHRKPL